MRYNLCHKVDYLNGHLLLFYKIFNFLYYLITKKKACTNGNIYVHIIYTHSLCIFYMVHISAIENSKG